METTSEKQGRILLVDDESAILRTFRYCLEDEGYSVATASSAPQAEALLQRQVFDLCFLDLRLGEDNGLDVLAQMRVQAPWMRVVIVTAHSAVDTAVDAMQAGAVDYLVKPCSPDQLRLAAAKQLEVRQLTARLEALEDEVRRQGDGLESHSPAMAAVLETARQVAATDANILILGESGSGKGELARAIHTWSKRAKKPQVTINCPSLTAELMESELFGHSRGAFTGATESTLGRVSQADGGTLFLDEIGDMPLALQTRLLRVLEERRVVPLGGEPEDVDVRLISATHRDLAGLVADGRFREDLYYRLNGMVVSLPPLRERSDREELLDYLLAEEARGQRIQLDGEVRQGLLAYRWPGNVRQMRTVLRTLVALCEDGRVGLRDLPADIRQALAALPPAAAAPAPAAGNSLDDAERAALLAALDGQRWHVSRVAEQLGISRNTLYRKLRRHGLVRGQA